MVPLALAFAATMGCYLAAVKATTAGQRHLPPGGSGTFWTRSPWRRLLLREKPADRRRSVFGIALAMVGVVLIVARGCRLADRRGIPGIVMRPGQRPGLRGDRRGPPGAPATSTRPGTWPPSTTRLTAGFLGLLARRDDRDHPRRPEPSRMADPGRLRGWCNWPFPYVLFARGAPARPGPRGRSHHLARACAQPRSAGVPQAWRAALPTPPWSAGCSLLRGGSRPHAYLPSRKAEGPRPA